MIGPRSSAALPAPHVERPRIRSRIGPWPGVATAWPTLLVAAAGSAATGWVAALLIRRVDGLSAPPYDLAFFQQVVWNVGTTGQWVSSFHQGSFLGLHFSPILVLPILVERFVWADVRILSLFHAAAVGALVPAAFLFLRAALRPSWAAGALAAAIAVVIPVWGAMQDVIRSDFHPETAGIVLALLAGWAGLTGRPRAMWAFAIVALVTREDLSYAVGVIGLFVAARGRGRLRRQGRILAVVAASWAVVVFGLVMPWIRDGAVSDTAHYYAWLGGGLGVLSAPFTMTDKVVAALTRPESWFVFAGLLVSLLGLPLVRPSWAVLVVPPLAAVLLSGHSFQAALRLQYPLILVVPLLVAAAAGGRRAIAIASRRGRGRDRQRAGRSAGAPLALMLLVAVPAVAGAWVQGSLPPFDSGDPAFADRPASIDRLKLIAASVPTGAPLLVDEGLLAPLAGRPAVGRLIAFAVPREDAYLLVDRDAWAPTGSAARRHRQIVTVLASSARSVLADDGRFVLWGPQPSGGAP
jgi:uncharacterized membrane protein